MAVLAVPLGALADSARPTLRPKEATPEELRRRLLSRELLQPEERARLVTTDEAIHEFRITEIDLEQDLVIDDEEQIPIVDLAAVETGEVGVGKTAFLVGGSGHSVITIVLLALAPVLILSGG